MKIRLARFNTYLLILLGLAWGNWGCQTDPTLKKAPKKGFSAISLHLEVNPDGTDKSTTVLVGRQTPFSINVNKAAFLETAHVTRASFVDDGMGGFALKLQLGQQGSWLLEQYTVSNKGRRIAVNAQLDDFHWIAAPLITKRISDGVFTFAPETSREEAEKLVLGLNKTIKKLQSRNSLNEPEPK